MCFLVALGKPGDVQSIGYCLDDGKFLCLCCKALRAAFYAGLDRQN
jgi:hypothetical protein